MNIVTFPKDTILPDGARVFVRNAFIFGDVKSRVGQVQGFNISVEDLDWCGNPRLEYQIKFGNESHWIPATHIEGFLISVK